MKEYVCSYSGGKDSTATVILAHEHNEPLDTILFSEVIFDKGKGISGELPEHIDFIKNKAFPLFESWGYGCEIVRSEKDFLDCFYKKRGERSTYCGCHYGFPIGGRCVINSDCKLPPIHKWHKEHPEAVYYTGIAIDEPTRLERAKGKGQISLLEKYNYTEQMAYELCVKYDLLSPAYKYSKRGGCWFCPNCHIEHWKRLRQEYPELYYKLYELEDTPNLAIQKGCRWINYGKWSIHDLENNFLFDEAQIKWEV